MKRVIVYYRNYCLCLFGSLFLIIGLSSSQGEDPPPPSLPSLNGAHFRVTVVEDDGWVNIVQNNDDDDNNEGNFNFTFSGYSVDVLRAVAERANFTFEMFPPSGFGSQCNHSSSFLNTPNENNNTIFPTKPYEKQYRSQYRCATSDVQDDPSSNNYTTDMYQAMFFVTPERFLHNRFSVPFIPPTPGGLQLYGTATRIRNIDDVIIRQQENTLGPVCLAINTAVNQWVTRTFPNLTTLDINSFQNVDQLLLDGTCEIAISPFSHATRRIFIYSKTNRCHGMNGMPIGLIGSVLPFGESQVAIGIRSSLSIEVDHAINYWLSELMTCSPSDAGCTNLASFYPVNGFHRQACGYVQFPVIHDDRKKVIAVSAISLAIAVILFTVAIFLYFHCRQTRKNRRIKRRLVLQIGRNISISKNPDEIPAKKLAQLINHIGQQKDFFTQDDFRYWMADLNLEYLSEKDLRMLWNLLDQNKDGFVSTIEFITFLPSCEREFAIVTEEINHYSKTELLKYKARDLDALERDGEEATRKKEFEIARRARKNQI